MGGKKKFGILLGCVMVAVAAAAIAVLALNEYSLTVHLNGPRELTLEYGESYEQAQCYVTKQGTLLLQQGKEVPVPVEIENLPDPKKLGDYRVSYVAKQGELTGKAEQLVHLVDTEAPVITVDENAPIPIFVPGESFEDNSYQAHDNFDGDLTDQVRILERQGEVQYSVSDSSGNETIVTRKVPEYDPLPPQIHLEGGNDYHVLVGHYREDPGYSAYDDFVGDLTDRVNVEGEVDWLVPGTYPLTYTVQDDYGNLTQVMRNVTVEAAQRPQQVVPQQRTVYLTFDDGPGPYTNYLLDVLKKYGVKATFFVVGNQYPAVMRRIVEEGHSIAVHSVTHVYRDIYASPEAYFDDILGEQAIIAENTGMETSLMRFPGGSSNMVSRFNEGIMSTLTEAVQDAGFQYFDWNVDSMDAGGARTAKQVLDNVIDGISQHRVSVVLQHDIHPFSVEAVEGILIWGLDHGYQFLPLTKDSFGAHHGVNN